MAALCQDLLIFCFDYLCIYLFNAVQFVFQVVVSPNGLPMMVTYLRVYSFTFSSSSLSDNKKGHYNVSFSLGLGFTYATPPVFSQCQTRIKLNTAFFPR
jgi:hypothetical protein